MSLLHTREVSGVSVAFSSELSLKDINAAVAFPPLQRHLEKIQGVFPDTAVCVDQVLRFPPNVRGERRVGMLYASATYRDPFSGKPGAYCYIVKPDGSNILALFHVTGTEIACAKAKDFAGEGYYVLALQETRFANGVPGLLGLPGGLAEAKETPWETGRREMSEETDHLRFPDVEPFVISAAPRHPMVTAVDSMLGLKGTICLDDERDLVFWNWAQGRKGGLRREGESGVVRLVRAEALLDEAVRPDFAAALWSVARTEARAGKRALLDQLVYS